MMMTNQMVPHVTQEVSKSDSKGQVALDSKIVMTWLAFGAVGLWIYHEIAEKAFTSILTLGVLAQALSFVLLQIQISLNKSVAGISGKTMIMHLVKLVCRLSSSLFLDGYLPLD